MEPVPQVGRSIYFWRPLVACRGARFGSPAGLIELNGQIERDGSTVHFGDAAGADA